MKAIWNLIASLFGKKKEGGHSDQQKTGVVAKGMIDTENPTGLIIGLLVGIPAGIFASPLLGLFLVMSGMAASSGNVNKMAGDDGGGMNSWAESNGDEPQKLGVVRFCDALKRTSIFTFKKPHTPTESYQPPPRMFTILLGAGACAADKKFKPAAPWMKLGWLPPRRISWWVAVAVGAMAGTGHWAAKVSASQYENLMRETGGWIAPGVFHPLAPLVTALSAFLIVSALAEAARWSSQPFEPQTEPTEGPIMVHRDGYMLAAIGKITAKSILLKQNVLPATKKTIEANSPVPALFEVPRGRIASYGLIAASVFGSTAGWFGWYGWYQGWHSQGSAGMLLGVVWGIGGLIAGGAIPLSGAIKDEMNRVYIEQKRKREEWDAVWQQCLPASAPAPLWVKTENIPTGYDVDFNESHFLLLEGTPMESYDVAQYLTGAMSAAGTVIEGGEPHGQRMTVTSSQVAKSLIVFHTESHPLGSLQALPHLKTWELPSAGGDTPMVPAPPCALFVMRLVLEDAFGQSNINSMLITEAWQHHKLGDGRRSPSENDRGYPPSSTEEAVVWQVVGEFRQKQMTAKNMRSKLEALRQAIGCEWVRARESTVGGDMELWFATVSPEKMVLKDEETTRMEAPYLPIPGGAPLDRASEVRSEIVDMDWRHVIGEIAGEVPHGFRVVSQTAWEDEVTGKLAVETVFYPMLNAEQLEANLEGRLDASYLYAHNIESAHQTRVSWGVGVDRSAYLDRTEPEKLRKETLIAVFRKYWNTGTKTRGLPDIEDVVFHTDPELDMDIIEIRCLPGSAKPLNKVSLADVSQAMGNMSIRWLRIGQKYGETDSFGYSIILSPAQPPRELRQPGTDFGNWLYILDIVRGLAEADSAMFSLKCSKVEALDVDGQLHRSEWELPAGVAPYQVAARMRDMPRGMSYPVAIPGLAGDEEDTAMYMVFGQKVPSEQEKWINPEDQNEVAGWGWKAMMTVCKIETEDRSVPFIEDTSIRGLTYRHRLVLPGGMSPGDIIDKQDKIKVSGKYKFLEFEPPDGDIMTAICAYEDPLPTRVDTPALKPVPSQWNLIPIGVGVRETGYDVRGFPHLTIPWDLLEAPHLLLVGTTGSGKSVATRGICAYAVARGHRLIIVDTTKQATDFAGIKDSPLFCERVALNMDTAYETITYCQNESHKRIDLNSEYSATAWYDLPREVRPRPILLVIDEFFSMVEPEPGKSPETKEENEMKQDIQLLCNKIGREARASGVHMVLITQRPDASAIKGNLKANLGARLVLGPADHTMRQMSFVDPQAAPKLEGRVPAGRGVFMQGGWGGVVQSFFPGGKEEIVGNLQNVFDVIERRKRERRVAA